MADKLPRNPELQRFKLRDVLRYRCGSTMVKSTLDEISAPDNALVSVEMEIRKVRVEAVRCDPGRYPSSVGCQNPR